MRGSFDSPDSLIVPLTRRAPGDAFASPRRVGLSPQAGRGKVAATFVNETKTITYSGNVTMRVTRARIWSSSMPTRPIRRIAMMTLVMERLFHSFQTK